MKVIYMSEYADFMHKATLQQLWRL